MSHVAVYTHHVAHMHASSRLHEWVMLHLHIPGFFRFLSFVFFYTCSSFPIFLSGRKIQNAPEKEDRLGSFPSTRISTFSLLLWSMRKGKKETDLFPTIWEHRVHFLFEIFRIRALVLLFLKQIYDIGVFWKLRVLGCIIFSEYPDNFFPFWRFQHMCVIERDEGVPFSSGHGVFGQLGEFLSIFWKMTETEHSLNWDVTFEQKSPVFARWQRERSEIKKTVLGCEKRAWLIHMTMQQHNETWFIWDQSVLGCETRHFFHWYCRWQLCPLWKKEKKTRKKICVGVRDKKVLQDETIMSHLWVSHTAGNRYVPSKGRDRHACLHCV